MDGVIEALHIYDEYFNPIVSHTYTARPLSAAHLLPLYLDQLQLQLPLTTLSVAQVAPPSLVYMPGTNPPTLAFAMTHANLLFLLTTSSEMEPLVALEFLHRVADALEEFLGSPLLASKIESGYDVVAQLLTELCDAGTVSTTEGNALRDIVEVEGLVGKLLGSITLPGKAAAALSSASSSPLSQSPMMPALSSQSFLAQKNNGPALPWRRTNVRHTSNEMYADVIESLSITLAPSGLPLAAFAHGSIVFTAKVSGVPDILVTLTGPSGKHNLGSILDLPVLHPCVRLARWRERPGELSFIPPDGRFLLASYEVDLMPSTSDQSGSGQFSSVYNNLRMPVSVEVQSNLGPVGADFEVRVNINRSFAFGSSGLSTFSGTGLGSRGAYAGTPGSPLLEDLKITLPLPPEVRNLLDIQPNKGDPVYNPGDRFLEWQIPSKDIASGTTYFRLRCTVVGQPVFADLDNRHDDNGTESKEDGSYYGFDHSGFGFQEYSYDDQTYQQRQTQQKISDQANQSMAGTETSDADARDRTAKKKIAQNKILMPSSASVSFSVKGWLASGVRVESIVLDTKRSRGLGEGVKPFKGVKYLTVSKSGIELRC